MRHLSYTVCFSVWEPANVQHLSYPYLCKSWALHEVVEYIFWFVEWSCWRIWGFIYWVGVTNPKWLLYLTILFNTENKNWSQLWQGEWWSRCLTTCLCTPINISALLSLSPPGNPVQASQSAVSIRILDVNDNPPELATPYEASICEDAKPGQVG